MRCNACPGVGRNPSQLPAGKGSVPPRGTDGAPSSYSPARHSGRRGEVLQFSGERDEPQEPESGRGMAGLHKGGGREGERDSQVCASRLIRGRGDGEEVLREETEHSSQCGWEARGRGTASRRSCCGAGIDAGRERAGQRTGEAPLHSQGGEREALLSRRSAVPPPGPRTLLGKPAPLLPARRQLGGCGCARLAKWRLCCPAGCCCARGGRRRERRRREGCESESGM